MRRCKKFFNMIEVVLAISVAAIGLAGIMAVIPVSLKAAKTSDNENMAHETVSTFFAIWDVLLKQPGTGKGWDMVVNDSQSQVLPTSKNQSSVTVQTAPYAKPANKEHTYDILNNSGNSIIDGASFQSNGIYRVWYGAPGSDYPDFTADILVWRDDITFVKWGPLTSDPSTIGPEPTHIAKDQVDPAMIRVCMELSWPVTVEYAKREKRLFVRDYYNPNKL